MATMPVGPLAGDGGDPRLSDNGQGIAEFSRRQLKNLHDPSVKFEEYLYYAKITREEEKGLAPGKHPLRMLAGFGRKKEEVRRQSVNMPSTDPDNEKEVATEGVAPYTAVADDEWMRAARAARTATWGAIFYLITTDILGPTSAPWAMYRMGLGPGITLYAIFGAFAGLGGWMLWKMFLDLDSNQYPLKTFGDLGYRIYGNVMRHFMAGLQSLQLIFNVGVIIIGNGQGLVQINGKLCYIVACVIWVACGMVLGQIRTLQRFGWIANLAIWMNVTVMIITMACVAHEPPLYSAASASNGVCAGPMTNTKNPALAGCDLTAYPPVMVTANHPPSVGFAGQIVGLMQAVFAYGGAMIFCEFMSEMRKPMDFWKGMLAAQGFIFCCYVFYGVFVYSFQGQYVINPANQGISAYAPQTAGNIISVISALIAAALYGNIGVKVLYQSLFKEMLGLPDLTTRVGKLLWVAMIPLYWGLAFLLAAAIPSFSNLGALIAALCILQFTYTFPPLLMAAHCIQKDAIQEGEGFNPQTGQVVRHDDGMKRWIRGFKVRWYWNTLNILYFLASLATAILGIYSSITGLISALTGATAATSFSCTSPLG